MKNEEILEEKFGISMNRANAFSIERDLEHLLDRCPSVATPLLSFKLKGNSYHAKLLINCFQQVFEVNARGKDPLLVYKALEKKMDLKLANWRKERVIDTSLSEDIMRFN